jgi:competence/damage-inducible protein CinA C-terminal domain
MFHTQLIQEASRLLERCRAAGVRIASAESCTGGLISALLTDIPGSSDVFDRGFITYSNQAKRELLDVQAATLTQHGAVSQLVALQMAEGALAHSDADLAVSVTGIAGPGGGTEQKPVGLVHFGCARRGEQTMHDQENFSGSRSEIRLEAVRHALRMLGSRV